MSLVFDVGKTEAVLVADGPRLQFGERSELLRDNASSNRIRRCGTCQTPRYGMNPPFVGCFRLGLL